MSEYAIEPTEKKIYIKNTHYLILNIDTSRPLQKKKAFFRALLESICSMSIIFKKNLESKPNYNKYTLIISIRSLITGTIHNLTILINKGAL